MSVLATLPAVAIACEGRDLTDDVLAALVRLDVDLRLNAPASCELTFAARSDASLDTLALGSALTVRVGSDRTTIFAGAIATIELTLQAEGVRVLRVLAYDALEQLRRGSPVRVHTNVTSADLAADLTRELGLTIAFDEPGPLRARIVQHRRSDFDVLLEAAERSARYLRLVGTELRGYPIAASGEARTLRVGAELREASLRLRRTDEAATIGVHGWDPHAVRALHGTAAGAPSATSDVALTNVVLQSDGQADIVARSQAERRAASGAVIDAVAEGDASLVPGCCVRLDGVPASFAGPYRLTATRHVLSTETGYVVEIGSTPPPAHPPPHAASAVLGVVTDAQDPAGLGRVKVRYPALDEAESDWLQVLAAGAGGKKGMIALPTPGDSVLVLGIDHDAAHGVVLGALYGSGGLPGESARNFKGYAFYSPGGHAIELDDDGALSLRTSGGTLLELGRDASTLHSTTDLRIEAPGKTLTIAADRVEIERS